MKGYGLSFMKQKSEYRADENTCASQHRLANYILCCFSMQIDQNPIKRKIQQKVNQQFRHAADSVRMLSDYRQDSTGTEHQKNCRNTQ